MAKTTVPGLYIADGAITAAKLSSTLDLSGVTLTVATASSGDNDTTVASTAFVQQEIAALVDSSPSALNTLNELAAAIGDDANFSTTVTNSIATKLALAGGTMTGDLIINTTGALQIPVGTTAQRPTAATGQFRFNSSTTKAEIYDGSSWSDVGGGVESVNSATGVVTLDTDDISEGSTNLYFTNARADARIAAATTDDLSEGSTNLYFTTARANSAIDGRLSGSTGVTVSNGAISIGQDVATSTSPTFQNLTLSGTDSIKVPAGTTAQRSGSPANGMLRYNSSTNEFEGYADSAWGAIGGDTTSSVDLYTVTGDGTSDTYDTGKNPQSENNTWVFIGGVYQPKSTYSYSGTEITLSENLPNGEDLEVITGTVSTYNPTDAILGQYNATTSNTASYDTSLTTENENNVFVFIDGVYQPKSSYTYSGSTLTLDATPTSGMSLEVLVTRSMNAATVTTGFLADDAVTTAKITDANVTADKLASSLDLTGKTVTVATASAGDNDTSVASTAFVRQEITALVDSAPAAMDTLNELAAALGDDANFSTTVNASIAAKLPLAGGTLTGDLNFGDSDKAIFGAGSDLQIYHDGTRSYISDQGTGVVRILTDAFQVMKPDESENLIYAAQDGYVRLYHDGSGKLDTTSTGIDVTGTVTNDGLIVDGNNDIQINRDGVSAAKIFWNRSGTTDAFLEVDSGENLTLAVDEAQLGSRLLLLRNNQTNVVSISSTSVDVTGSITSTGAITAKSGGGFYLQPTDAHDTDAWILYQYNDNTLRYNFTGAGADEIIIKYPNATNATTLLIDTEQQRVGIGNTSPSATLDVDGTIKLDGNYPTGTNNVALGNAALSSITNGSYNTAIGAAALRDNVTGSNLTGLGYGALTLNTGSNNTGVGYKALHVTTTGANNTAVGSSALLSNTTGYDNVAVGRNALDANVGGHSNTALGESSLTSNTSGIRNVAIGQNAMAINSTGNENVAIGRNALDANTTASYNTAVGDSALTANTTGSSNTALGRNALSANTTAINNVALGANALEANTTGTGNVAVGVEGLTSNTEGSQNTTIGHKSLNNNTATGNTAIGYFAARFNTTGVENTALGRYALYNNTTGSYNTAVGNLAMQNGTVTDCIAIGAEALRYNSGNRNIAIGNEACTQADGDDNIVIGDLASDASTFTGSDNVFIGNSAATRAGAADSNVCIGKHSADQLTTGDDNTFVGYDSGDTVTTGFQNTCIGGRADASATIANATSIGYNVTVTQTNNVFIGNSSVSAIKGQVAFSTYSDERIKREIEDSDLGLEFIKDLKPRKYKRVAPKDYPEEFLDKNKNDLSNPDEVVDGLIAQEVKQTMDKLGVSFSGWDEDENTTKQSLEYATFVPALIKSIQELSSQVDELKTEIQTLKGE